MANEECGVGTCTCEAYFSIVYMDGSTKLYCKIHAGYMMASTIFDSILKVEPILGKDLCHYQNCRNRAKYILHENDMPHRFCALHANSFIDEHPQEYFRIETINVQ